MNLFFHTQVTFHVRDTQFRRTQGARCPLCPGGCGQGPRAQPADEEGDMAIISQWKRPFSLT